MKVRFTSLDIAAGVSEIKKLIGMRVIQIYDIDHRTYLIKLGGNNEKVMLLLESGIRFHLTQYEWPKNTIPSSFSMKMRKHLKNKRLEEVFQFGTDRIINLTFGSGEFSSHIILELYDRGNIILTDHEYVILNILRPWQRRNEEKFAVRQKYSLEKINNRHCSLDKQKLECLFEEAKNGDPLRKILLPKLDFGLDLLEHALLYAGFSKQTKFGTGFIQERDLQSLLTGLQEAEKLLTHAMTQTCQGFIIEKHEIRIKCNGQQENIKTFLEFQPFQMLQHKQLSVIHFPSFLQAVDEFFSQLESQKLDMQALQQEKDLLRKLDHIKIDQEQRLLKLQEDQELDQLKAEYIIANDSLINKAIFIINNALANHLSWSEVEDIVNQAKDQNDPIAVTIKKLKLHINHIMVNLSNPYDLETPSLNIDINLELSASANAKQYYDKRRQAAEKEKKTKEALKKALRSAEQKTWKAVKEIQFISNIQKIRKTFWFEKFYWFISSENYLVIGGRDQQQNEILVKKYLRQHDIYVHADLHGGSSIIIKNYSIEPVPPKTLNEAGVMALCYSTAWDAKVISSAWWVYADQVSKTAPTGEYLTTGSFMIRGKKNYLPPYQLAFGFGFIFRLEDSSIAKHCGERNPKYLESDNTRQKLHFQEMEENTCDENEKNDVETENIEFPDNTVNIEIDYTNHFEKHFKTISKEDEEYTFIINENPVKFKQKMLSGTDKHENTENNIIQDKSIDTSSAGNKLHRLKRGQKGKLKKIKDKYKNQDEEERKLRMEILHTSLKTKLKKEKKNIKKNKCQNINQKILSHKEIFPKVHVIPEQDDDLIEYEEHLSEQQNLLDTLTGIPLPDDELLFAVPVCAPYSVILNYKYKIKLTPGNTHRGKAAKLALNIFLNDRSALNCERDLLNSTKDQDLSRNFPGKVKLSISTQDREKIKKKSKKKNLNIV